MPLQRSISTIEALLQSVYTAIRCKNILPSTQSAAAFLPHSVLPATMLKPIFYLSLLLSTPITAFVLPPSSVQDVFNTAPAPNEIDISKKCDCTGTNNTHNKKYICGDPRLGPVKLPHKFPLVAVVGGYDRLGGLTPGQFLEKWTDENGNWIYPPKGGYLLDLDGKPIYGNTTLKVGIKVDRFGSEYGSYVAEAEGPYDQRALPPSNLNTNPDYPDYPLNYHVYRVIKEFTVEAGPVASWFGQPGLGAQFYTGYTGNILKLLDLGYLERVNKTDMPEPGGRKGRCG